MIPGNSEEIRAKNPGCEHPFCSCQSTCYYELLAPDQPNPFKAFADGLRRQIKNENEKTNEENKPATRPVPEALD